MSPAAGALHHSGPFQPRHGRLRWPLWFVFSAKRSRISKPLDNAKKVPVIHLSVIRRSAIGHAGKLDVSDMALQVGQSMGQVAFHQLHVVTIEHQFEVLAPHCADDGDRRSVVCRKYPAASYRLSGSIRIVMQWVAACWHAYLRFLTKVLWPASHSANPAFTWTFNAPISAA